MGVASSLKSSAVASGDAIAPGAGILVPSNAICEEPRNVKEKCANAERQSSYCLSPRNEGVSENGLLSNVCDTKKPSKNEEEIKTVEVINIAAVNGDKSQLQKLTDGKPHLFHLQDSFGRTPLMLAVLADRLEIARYVFKKAQKNASSSGDSGSSSSYLEIKDKGGRTALHCAAHKGNAKCLKFLLSKGADPLAKDENGHTSLHLSTRHRSSRCLNLILNRLQPGGVDDQDNQNRTALHLSASYTNLKHVQSLLKHYSNICIPDAEGKTPLHWAVSAAAGDARTAREATAIVRLFREVAPSVINWPDYEGRTALHVAIAEGNVHIVGTLIQEEQCNVNAMDNMFRTALHWASALGHTQVVNMLLTQRSAPTDDANRDSQNGADWSTSDANGATPLHYAAQNNYDGTVRAFLTHDGVVDIPDLEGRTALMWAACEGADDVVRTMIRGGSDVSATDKTGGSALHVSAYAGKTATVKLLLDHGACIDGTDLAGHTPLFRACQQGHMMVVQTLLEMKARVDIVDSAGRSPLHWAGLSGHGSIARLLIKHGLDANVPDHSGRGPLHCAAFGGFVNCLSMLLENCADLNLQDNEGKTGLHWACAQGHLDAVKLLMEHGAYPNLLEFSEDRFTPLDQALLGSHNDVAQVLIEQGGLSINAIQDIAASVIQACFRGYRVRKSFQEKMNLMIQHDQLRKVSQQRRKAREAGNTSGSVLTSMTSAPLGRTVDLACFERREDSFGELHALETAMMTDCHCEEEKDDVCASNCKMDRQCLRTFGEKAGSSTSDAESEETVIPNEEYFKSGSSCDS